MALALVAATVTAGCATPPPPLELEERFRLVGFRDDMGYPKDLFKWTSPIRVHAEGATVEQRHLVKEHTDLLGQATGLPARIDPIDPNLIVLFGGEAELQPYLDDWSTGDRLNWPGFFRSDCFARVGVRDGEQFAMAFILQGLPERKTRLCVVQEMTQALGLFGDIDGRPDTSFASWGGADHLTEYDLALLQILYDDRLHSGMSEAVGMQIVRRIIAEQQE